MTQEATITASDGTKPAQMLDVEKLPPDVGVGRLISHALKLGASDLFFVANHEHVAVQVRHLGIMRPISVLSNDQARKYLSHIRANAGMDITEKRRPADGRWIYDPEEGEAVDLRISTIPTIYGEDFAVRLISHKMARYDLEGLGMGKDQYHRTTAMLSSPAGMILICGPTGSGKTTTLYSALMRLNNGQRKINTIEDPIEYAIDGLRQSQINPTINLGYGELLRSVLRQSPDIIMIGEVRDAETAATAVHAANAGMLVFATVHAPSAAGAIQSMKSLGVNPHFLAASLRGVVAQRLVRTLCPKCKVSFNMDEAPETFDEVKQWLEPGEGKLLFAPRGCDECGGTGYTARTGVFEVMTISKEIRNIISDNRSSREVRTQAISEKMLEFRQAALLKVARGLTSTEECFRVIPTEHLLLDD
jgi:type II secretory ATPase GspE/PulE/Tfp pilus assembly ATPase PilB-like protein